MCLTCFSCLLMSFKAQIKQDRCNMSTTTNDSSARFACAKPASHSLLGDFANVIIHLANTESDFKPVTKRGLNALHSEHTRDSLVVASKSRFRN